MNSTFSFWFDGVD